MKKFGFALLGLLSAFSLLAQEQTEMADVMRSNGKIYVVVAVLSIIFIGLMVYLIRLDRKLGKLEKDRS